MAFVDPLDEAADPRGGARDARHRHRRGGAPSAAASAPRWRAGREHQPVPMRILGVPASSRPPAAPILLEHFGLTADGIAARPSPSDGGALSHIARRSTRDVSATKAVLVDARRRDRRPRRGAGRARAPPARAGSSRTRRRSGQRSRPPSRMPGGQRPQRRRRRRAQHPARVAACSGSARRACRSARCSAGRTSARPPTAPRCARQAPSVRRRRSAGCRSTRCSPRQGALAARPTTRPARSRRELCLGTVDASWLLSRSAASTSSRSATPRAPSCSTSATRDW